MSDYTPHDWSPGDDRTAARLNNIETGIDTLHSELATHEADAANPHSVDAADISAMAQQVGAENWWVQSAEPTALATGDLWIDTDLDHLFHWDGADWTRIRDLIRHWDGAEWVARPFFYWNGSAWRQVEMWDLINDDDFDRSDTGTTGWTENPSSNWLIKSNRLRHEPITAQHVNTAHLSSGAVVDSRAECVPFSTGIGPMLAEDISAETGVGVLYESSPDRVRLFSFNRTSGSVTYLATKSQSITLGTDLLKIQRVGETVSAFVNDEEALSVTRIAPDNARYGVVCIGSSNFADVDDFAYYG